MRDRRTRKHPVYIGVQILFSLLLFYLAFRLGGVVPAAGLALLFAIHLMGEFLSFVKIYSGFLLYRKGWGSVKISYKEIAGINYIHQVGGREFYRIYYQSGGKKRVLKLHSYMFTRLHDLIRGLEEKGIPVSKKEKKKDYVAWSLFGIITLFSLVILRQVLVRGYTFLQSAFSGGWHLYNHILLWVLFFLFTLFILSRLFLFLRQGEHRLFFSRVFLHLVIVGLLYLFLQDYSAQKHGAEMFRILVDVKYQCETARYEKKPSPYEVEEGRGCELTEKTRLMKGWHRVPVRVYRMTSEDPDTGLFGEPGRIIVFQTDDGAYYYATAWEKGHVRIIAPKYGRETPAALESVVNHRLLIHIR
jgi:uncharacterized membrane protein